MSVDPTKAEPTKAEPTKTETKISEVKVADPKSSIISEAETHTQLKSKNFNQEEEEEDSEYESHAKKKHHKKNKQPRKINKIIAQEEEVVKDEEEEPKPHEKGMAEDYAGDACHEMEFGDACTALFCPCITYGQTLETLDPTITHMKRKKKKDNEESNCHVSTGCLLWTGLMGITIGGIQSLISIPGACGWMPTMYFADIFDARELFLACGYLAPQWVCHLPLRTSIVGGKSGENCCCSCLITSFCCCCSLSSLKTCTREKQIKYNEDDVCMSKCCPLCGVFDTRNQNVNRMDEGEEEERMPRTETEFFRNIYSQEFPLYHSYEYTRPIMYNPIYPHRL